jgi:hypothetical protein
MVAEDGSGGFLEAGRTDWAGMKVHTLAALPLSQAVIVDLTLNYTQQDIYKKRNQKN